MSSENLTVWIVFGAGFLSFISPCCLPLYPSFLSYITGVSVKELKDGKGALQKQALLHTIFFIIGFSIIFFALGLSASIIGNVFSENKDLIRKLGGLLVAFMGLIMLGIFTPDFFMKNVRYEWKKRPVGYFGSVLVGITYAAGWTPCVGPILAAVLAIGLSDPGKALIYTFTYSLGFSIPFLLMAFFIGKLKWILAYSNVLMKIGGGIMIMTGILLYTNNMTKITTFLIKLYGGFIGV